MEFELWIITKLPCGCVVVEYLGTMFAVEEILEFPVELIGCLAGRGGDVQDQDEEVDVEFSEETLKDYLEGAQAKYWADEEFDGEKFVEEEVDDLSDWLIDDVDE